MDAIRTNTLLRCGAALIISAGFLTPQVITTVAGSDWTFPATPLPAVNAPLGSTSGVAVDGNGNVCLADSGNNMVMRVATDGTLTVVAGNGVQGFSGDGGAATNAAMNLPEGIAVDSAGDLYIADSANCRIRKVSDGIITTVAGNGIQGFSGDDGSATNAAMNLPEGIAVDSAGDLYIADRVNSRIRKVSNGIITTVAGNGTPDFSGDGGLATSAALDNPSGVAVDSASNLYIADSGNHRVRKVSAGIITTIAGTGAYGFSGEGGPATSAELYEPSGIAVDSTGKVYIADTDNQRIREVSTGIITTVGGNGTGGFSGDGGPATSAAFGFPNAVASDSTGNLYIADLANGRIRRVSGGIIKTVAGNGTYNFSGDGGSATSAKLNRPFDVTIDSANNLYIADMQNNRIRKLSSGVITTVAGNGTNGFAGDGGSAASGQINSATGVAVDSVGNLYISDFGNNRVRKVSDGIITTVAGNGLQGFFGDGGPPGNARFYAPLRVAVDSADSLYIADLVDNRVRKVSNGIITTVVGDGAAGYSGDGGPPIDAALDNAHGVAVDSAGNIYIADSSNKRVRRVSDGAITTVVGNGASGFSGDGGPAIDAALYNANDVAVDALGNLYVADGHRIRKVSGGVIATVAGNGSYEFSGDGGSATNAALNSPGGVAVDSDGNLYIADTGNNRIREVLATAPFFMSPSSASVSLAGSGGGKPATTNLIVSTVVNPQSKTTVPAMTYTVQVTGGSPWLSVSPPSGNTPGLLTVKADPLNLAPGTYQGTITITLALASPSVRTVNVQFTVGQAIAPSLSVDHDHLSFTYAKTSAGRSQTITVSNQGGGPLAFTTSVTLDSGQAANWLTATPQSGTATPSTPVVLNVTADPGSLTPGAYTGRVKITGTTPGTGSVTIPVTMTITTNPLIMLLSQTGLTFTAVQNGGAVPPQNFGVLNLGSGVLNWTVQTSTLKGGNWLIATPNSGASDAASTTATPLVTVSVNPAGLDPGVYYGLVKVISSGAANIPQEVVAVLQVLPAGTDVAPIVLPNTLVFTGAVGTSSPGSQDVLVYDPTGTSKSFRSGKTTVTGGDWFVTLPGDATIAPAQPTRIVVQPRVDGLGPGTYQGTLTLQFSDGRVSAVGITFIVTATGGGLTSSAAARSVKSMEPLADAGNNVCNPQQLLPSLISLGIGFNVPAGYPQGLEATVVDNCGAPHLSGTVFVEFSNGDPPVKLSSLNNGRWQGTWVTGARQVSQVTLTVKAQNPALQIKGEGQVTGGLGAQQPAPVVADNGVVSAASFAARVPLAPGGLISILGQRLSEGTLEAPRGPLPSELASTVVTIGDQILPLLYASDTMVYAVAPYKLNANTNQQLLVQRGSTYATPVYVDVAAAQPALFQIGQTPIILDKNSQYITANNPAHAGDVLAMYSAGLGAVNPPVADGVPAPSPVSQTANPVSVSIGGKNGSVSSAGLIPGLVGVYLINVTVPQGAPTGDQVPVVISAGGQASAPVTVSVR